ncbi:MAG: hypothetical protein AAFY84_08385 [Pseudomonadota bacterium]
MDGRPLRSIRKSVLSLFGLAVAAIVLTGCFVSEQPILTEKNARALAFKAGPLLVCPYVKGELDGDCKPGLATNTPNRAMLLAIEKDQTYALRFQSIRRNMWIGQMSPLNQEEGHIYLLARKSRTYLSLGVLACNETDPDLVARLVSEGSLKKADNEYVCKIESEGALKDVVRDHLERTVPPAFEIRLSRP